MTTLILAAVVIAVIALCYFTPGPESGAKTITAYTMPWCGACKRLQPEWDRLTAMQSADVGVRQVNCQQQSCTGISSYPTITCSGAVYSGERTAEAMWAWAQTV